MVSEKELREYYNFFTGLWKIFKENHSPKTDDDWSKLIQAYDELARGVHFKTKMAATMCVAVLDEIERIYKDEQIQQGDISLVQGNGDMYAVQKRESIVR